MSDPEPRIPPTKEEHETKKAHLMMAADAMAQAFAEGIGTGAALVGLDRPAPPHKVTLWFCPECGHWAGSSYLAPPASNPDWRPRCKMKPPVKCSRPLMRPMGYTQASSPLR